MASQILHRHKPVFRRHAGVTRAVCDTCGVQLVDDVHRWANDRMLDETDTEGHALELTLRQAIEQAVNRDG